MVVLYGNSALKVEKNRGGTTIELIVAATILEIG
jgi:hypothetical protein